MAPVLGANVLFVENKAVCFHKVWPVRSPPAGKGSTAQVVVGEQSTIVAIVACTLADAQHHSWRNRYRTDCFLDVSLNASLQPQLLQYSTR